MNVSIVVPCEVEPTGDGDKLILTIPLEYVSEQVENVGRHIKLPTDEMEVVLRPDLRRISLYGKPVRIIGGTSGA